jgi:hypothetical protein
MSWFGGTAGEFTCELAGNLITGMAVATFWYIPVLLALYILTPLLAKLLVTPGTICLRVIIIAAPLVTSRVWPEVSWNNYIYFLGAYLIGMFVGSHYQQTVDLVRRYWIPLAVTAVVTSAAALFVSTQGVELIGIINLAESAWYLQKIVLTGLVLLWFDNSMKNGVPGWLSLMGDYAFAWFFFHVFFLMLFISLLGSFQVVTSNGLEFCGLLLLTFTVVLGA